MDLESMYRENYHIVRGYVFSLCDSMDLAEDIASETFLRAIRRIDSYDGSCRPSTWLCAIAKNLCFDELRRRKKLHGLAEMELADDGSFEQYMADREDVRRILREAAKLKSEVRQTFFMRLEGLSFREIGEALGRSENWARVNYFRAKNNILERMEERE